MLCVRKIVVLFSFFICFIHAAVCFHLTFLSRYVLLLVISFIIFASSEVTFFSGIVVLG